MSFKVDHRETKIFHNIVDGMHEKEFKWYENYGFLMKEQNAS